MTKEILDFTKKIITTISENKGMPLMARLSSVTSVLTVAQDSNNNLLTSDEKAELSKHSNETLLGITTKELVKE